MVLMADLSIRLAIKIRRYNFSNPKISSITIDAHKMLQAPYGTGIFICRKGLIENVLTKEANT
jgi:tyrosine decarboxylase/aspartate 1-decarboxylase